MAGPDIDAHDTRRIDDPFYDRDDDWIDQQATNLIDTYVGLKKYEATFIKAARILGEPRGWRNIETSGAGPLSGEEFDDLLREEAQALDHNNQKPFWKFWETQGSGVKSLSQGTTQPRPSGFWYQPKELRTTIITLAIAAVVQGWNQTGANGGNLTWVLDLGLINPNNPTDCDTHGTKAWIFAIVNAAPWFSASIFALLLSDPANELLFGRRAALVLSACFILAASLGGAFVQRDHWWQFLLCRVLLGIGMGCKASVVAVFAAEVAPARIRGSLVMNWQLFDALGIFLGFSANLMFSVFEEQSWRWMTASSAFPTVILLTLVLTGCCESPRFLMGRKRYLDAYETFTRLRGSRILAAKELLFVHYQMRVENSLARPPRGQIATLVGARRSRDADHCDMTKKPNFLQRLWQMFTVRRIRNSLATAIVCMVSQQTCGVNVLIFYSSTIYADVTGVVCETVTTKSLRGPLLMSWGLGLTNFLFAFPAYWLIDRRGRRWLLTTTLPFLFLLMGGAALSYVNGSHKVALGLFSYLFVAVYSWGLGPVPFTISAEVFPLDHRVIGMSLAVFSNFFFAGLLTLFVPAVTASALGHGGLLGIFTFLIAGTFVMVWFFVRETVGARDADNPASMTALALEELYKIFDVKMSDFWRYEYRVVLPWAMSYLKFWGKPGKQSEPLEPLYRWAAKQGQSEPGKISRSRTEPATADAFEHKGEDVERRETVHA